MARQRFVKPCRVCGSDAPPGRYVCPDCLSARHARLQDLGRHAALHNGIRGRVWAAQGGRCADCGEVPRFPEVHHIRAVRDGGTRDLANLQGLCRGCHRSRHRGNW